MPKQVRRRAAGEGASQRNIEFCQHPRQDLPLLRPAQHTVRVSVTTALPGEEGIFAHAKSTCSRGSRSTSNRHGGGLRAWLSPHRHSGLGATQVPFGSRQPSFSESMATEEVSSLVEPFITTSAVSTSRRGGCSAWPVSHGHTSTPSTPGYASVP